MISESLDEVRIQMKKFGDTLKIEKSMKKKHKKEGRKSRKSHVNKDDDEYEEHFA